MNKVTRNIFLILMMTAVFNSYADNSAAENDFQNENNPHALTFAEASFLAVAASDDLKYSRASQAVTEGAWRWGIRAYFPKLSLSVSENDRLQKIGADSFMKNYGISVEQLIWDGGRTSMSRNIERIDLDLSNSRLERMADDIAENAIAAYRNILSSRAILEIKTAALGILEEQRRILNEEVNLGLALAVDLTGADISIAEARLDIHSLQIDLAELEKQFIELLKINNLPVLAENVDIYRAVILPPAAAAAVLAREQNSDLTEARYSISKKQIELKYASRSWIPVFKLNCNLGFTGQSYPLTRFNWSVGISIEFSTPWLQNRFGLQAGWELPHDRTAMLQNSLSPLPDPASGFNRTQAALSLELEQKKYNSAIEQIGRMAANAVDKCVLAAQKRDLAAEAAALGGERCRIEEIRLELGQITRLKLMESLIEQTQREIAVVQAATYLLEAERELERFLSLSPGELAVFSASISALSAGINQ